MSIPVTRAVPDPMTTLCRMVINTSYDSLPSNVVVYAKHCILDIMAIMIGGSTSEGIPEIVDFIKDKGGKPQSIIPLYGGKVPASEAAFAIGPMVRALDLGDAHYEGGHCTEYIFPSLLAATGLREKVSGKEFLTALVVGQEMLVRIGIAYRLVKQAMQAGQIGGHYIFGTIASVGKILGLSFDELENAEGIGRAMTQPFDVAMIDPPTLMIRGHHAFIGQDAINACLLAQRGITGPRGEFSDVLAGPKGYLSFARWQTDPSGLTRDLGTEWEMLNLVMKPYPCCGQIHTSIEGILNQMKEHHFEAEDIAAIDLDVSSLVSRSVCSPKEAKWNPQTATECQFSLPYLVATAAFEKDIFIDSFSPKATNRREVRELMTRISAREDASLPLPFGVRVNTRLLNGRRFSKECFYAKGHPEKPFTENELINRFKKYVPYSVYKLDNRTVDSLIEAILNLEKTEDVIDCLLNPLTPG